MSTDKKKLTLVPLILMIFTSVYGFTNIVRAFWLMGYSSIIWYVLSALLFFVPYAFMLAEYGAAFKGSKGGIYTWMAESYNPRFAFVGIFMWYASYIIWMVNVSSSIWVPMSNIIFGVDKTQSWSLFGLSSTQTLGILGILLVCLITFIATHGVEKIQKFTSVGGTATALINLVVLLVGCVILVKNGHMQQSFELADFFSHSPNPDYQSGLSILSFVVFAIFAYGGLEVVGGLVDETEKPEKTFPKAIVISAVIIAVGYSLLIFVMGMFTNWDFAFTQFLPKGEEVTMANVAYVGLNNMGYQLGLAFGAAKATAVVIGQWFARYVGLSMFLALGGAFFTIVFSPLKQLIEGTPKEIWPKSWEKTNKHGMPVTAMIWQAAAVCVIILFVAFGGAGAEKFFNILVAMCNVSMTIPYMFIAFAFYFFKKKQSIEKPFEMYKKPWQSTLAVIVVTLVVGLANIFTIIEPAMNGDLQTTIFSIAGPIIFTILALVLYSRYSKKHLNK